MLIVLGYENWHVKNLLRWGSFLGIHLQERRDHSGKIAWILCGNFRVYTFGNFCEKTFHVSGCERRIKCSHFVQNSTHRPNVTRLVIGFILPNLRRCIVRRSSLCLQLACLSNFAHIQVSQLHSAVFSEEDICTLNVSMNNFFLMETVQTRYHLIENWPNVGFFHVCASLF